MNRREFIKSIGLTTTSLLLPNNIHSDNEYIEDVPAEDIKFSTDILTLEEIENNKTKYNGLLVSSYGYSTNIKDCSIRLTSNRNIFGKKTKEYMENHYSLPSLVWFLQEEPYPLFKFENLRHDWIFFGYNGPSDKIIAPCRLENKYILWFIDFTVCGISKGLQTIEFEDYSGEKKEHEYYPFEKECDIHYPIIYSNKSNRLFQLSFEELNQLSLNRIILPKRMFEENKEYIPFIEKNTKIRFETN